MARAPWYKRYAADFVSDPYVQAMTAEQYGWFSAMLDYSWIHSPIGRLPNDLSLICRMIGRCDEMYFVQHSKIVIDRFKVSPDGLWLYHPKMLEQAEKLTQVSENKSHPGKAGRKKTERKEEINRKSDDFQKEIKQGGESDSESDKEIPSNSDEQIEQIVSSHPACSHLRPEELPSNAKQEAIDCIIADGFEVVLGGTKAFAAIPEEQRKFDGRLNKNAYEFLKARHYRHFKPIPKSERWDIVAETRKALLS